MLLGVICASTGQRTGTPLYYLVPSSRPSLEITTTFNMFEFFSEQNMKTIPLFVNTAARTYAVLHEKEIKIVDASKFRAKLVDLDLMLGTPKYAEEHVKAHFKMLEELQHGVMSVAADRAAKLMRFRLRIFCNPKYLERVRDAKMRRGMTESETANLKYLYLHAVDYGFSRKGFKQRINQILDRGTLIRLRKFSREFLKIARFLKKLIKKFSMLKEKKS